MKGAISLNPSQIESIEETVAAGQEQETLDQLRHKKGASAKRDGSGKRRKSNPGQQKGREKSIKDSPTPAATVTVPPVAPAAINTAPALEEPVQTPAPVTESTKIQEVTKVTKLSDLKNVPVNRIQGQFNLRPITPRIQAVVDRLVNDLPSPLPAGVMVRHDQKRGKTTLTIETDKNGNAVIPASLKITPNTWNMSLGVEKRIGEITAVCYLRADNKDNPVYRLKPYFTLNKEGRQPIHLYGFSSTTGPTQYSYIIQVNDKREALITKWGIRVVDRQRANRDRGEVIMHERLPLNSEEKTAAAMPVLLQDFSKTLCAMYEELTNVPAETKPAAPPFTSPS